VTPSPAFVVQRSDERFYGDHDWLKTFHSFSFADYYDPHNVNFGALRVFNDDRVAPGSGFPTHPHRDMEILTYVLSGKLEHRDSLGNHGIVGPGGVQYMSAGTGVRHSEHNHSRDEELHFIQMWVLPRAAGLAPKYGQRDFTSDDRSDRWFHVAAGGSGQPPAPIELRQDAHFYVSRLRGSALEHSFSPKRLRFLFVADGDVAANGLSLRTGDAVRMSGVDRLTVEGSGELLLWDVPPTQP